MKQPAEKIKAFLQNKSLRWKIMLSVFLAIVVMVTILVITLRLNINAIENLGDSYKSNSELNKFTQVIAETEKSMELYLTYHTFDSIDSYYMFRNKIEEFSEGMQDNPSLNEVLQKEYIVNQFAKSFVFYSGKAVAAKRANNQEELSFYYKKASDCYSMLMSQLLEWNKILLEQNARKYEADSQGIRASIRLSFLFFSLFSFIVFVFVYITITSLTKPLADISEVAHRVSKRDFDVPLFDNNSNDEIGNICRAFDRMIISIREYIDTIWEKARTEAELKEKEIEMQALYTDAQLRALQNQINPHFLFNTLNTGAQLAMMEGADKTCYFIEQVSNFFRYNIQQQKRTATIDEELGLVDNFVYIMKVRFGNRLEFIKDIPSPPELNAPEETALDNAVSLDGRGAFGREGKNPLSEVIPVMVLQPLVENCIKHGLNNSKGVVKLKIRDVHNATAEDVKGSGFVPACELKNFIEISIVDNGSGMSDEIKENVFKSVKTETTRIPSEILENELSPVSVEGGKHTGTGLINVFLRLKLYFHRDDIFDICSGDDGKGTKFIIRIPAHV